ncbi:PfkB family carbohydrate kinase [Paracoccus aminophilus]|uniref:2-dehydro-3-deoxygluconokinase n=1 Tax=Paracoccus aminophilus JCM 7686 TaxID=1367847 RepID=S5XT08_PARAH|nr:PfkB family carbohydrate kinase [Paracoccus aminophilus]AGT08282.1 2-dehydro-3-deoxygluconokinase [Paracoccus aminophilus JCM 7686]
MSALDILCIGECIVEFAPLAGDQEAFRRRFIGDSLATAEALARLGHRVGFATRIGTDAISREMGAFIAAQGISPDWITTDPSRSVGVCAISPGAGMDRLSSWRDQSAARLLARDPVWLARALAAAPELYLTGMTLAILERDRDREQLLDALARARAGGARIVLAPHLCPEVWRDQSQMCRWISRAARGADLVLTSAEDEIRAFGDASTEAVLARYQGHRVREIVLRCDAGPVVGWQAGRSEVSCASAPSNLDPSRDRFNAGYLAARTEGNDMLAALAAGVRLAEEALPD